MVTGSLSNHPKDHGCKLYPVCLLCPLPRCVEEMPYAMQNERLLSRAIEVDKLRKQGMSVAEIASQLHVSVRTVNRSLSLLK